MQFFRADERYSLRAILSVRLGCKYARSRTTITLNARWSVLTREFQQKVSRYSLREHTIFSALVSPMVSPTEKGGREATTGNKSAARRLVMLAPIDLRSPRGCPESQGGWRPCDMTIQNKSTVFYCFGKLIEASCMYSLA